MNRVEMCVQYRCLHLHVLHGYNIQSFLFIAPQGIPDFSLRKTLALRESLRAPRREFFFVLCTDVIYDIKVIKIKGELVVFGSRFWYILWNPLNNHDSPLRLFHQQQFPHRGEEQPVVRAGDRKMRKVDTARQGGAGIK